MPVSFELESALQEEDEEFESLVQETVDGQANGTSRRQQRPTSTPEATSGKRKYILLLLIMGLILFIVAYPRGDETIDETEDTFDKPDGHHNEASPISVPASVPAPTEPPAPAPTEPPKAVERPGTGPIGAPGWKMTASRLSDKYLPKGQVMTPEARQAMIQQWGQWTFKDTSKERPADDFYAKYSNRDVPRDKFPSNAWQLDTEYLAGFLDASLELVTRAQEAILAEYGHGPLDMPGVEFDERAKMFHVNMIDFADDAWEKETNVIPGAGWHDKTGWDNLQRRILHAIMTEDSFTYLMGGHSAAAGHGNHYWQSYTLQMGKVIEPVFARLGVFFKAHNIGMGGLGTGHNAMGAKDIYGTDIDIIAWDSGMTERSWAHLDLFMRSSFISGGKVPVIWGAMGGSKLREFAQNTGGDIGLIGISDSSPGYAGIPDMPDFAAAGKLPWAYRYMKCTGEQAGECNAFKYNVQCWIDRPDVTPVTGQAGTNPGGQVGWHPGWRHHQIVGRSLAFALLRATRQALKRWKEAEGYVLPDEAWHVTSHYEAIRSKTLAFSSPDCQAFPGHEMFCKYPMNARTEFTPRVNGYSASLRSIMKVGGVVPKPNANLYDPPDVPYKHAEIPAGAVDALNIIENGIDFATNRARKKHVERLVNPLPYEYKSNNYITPGKGSSVSSSPGASDNCDGTIDSFCNRAASQNCLLLHHNDGRNGIFIDSLSGWVVLDIANVVKGLIVVKIETWHQSGEGGVTKGWTCENNECPPGRQLELVDTRKETRVMDSKLSHHEAHWFGNTTGNDNIARQLGGPPPPVPCDDFRFEFAIDGKITSWTNMQFEERRKEIERVVNVWTLLDDASYAADGPKDVELAIRLTGCATDLPHSPTFSLTHVYWA